MKKWPLFLMFFLLISCRTLPVINASSSAIQEKPFACPSPFLKEKFRLVHAIETRMAGNMRGAIIGVTLADPENRSIACAIMTAEGMVLFDAESNPIELTVSRALPPFDSGNFAKNMFDDIKLIFLTPEGNVQNQGHLPDGSTVCRYLEENGHVIDVIENKTGGLEIKRYSSSGDLKRHIRYTTKETIYQRIELQANEIFDYSLIMTLIEAGPVKQNH